MTQAHTPTAQQRFLSLLEHDILKLDAAELDFGIYRILAYRREQVLAYLRQTLPQRIDTWAAELAATSGQALADDEAAHCYYHLHTFFNRYWDDGDFIPRARRGGTAAYAVPYHGQDTHFHWATKGSHYVKSGELFARFAYRDGEREVRFVLDQADISKDNAKGGAKHFFPVAFKAADSGFELHWQWRAPTEAEAKRYKRKTAQASDDEADDELFDTEGSTLQERVLNAWLQGQDYKAAQPHAGVNTELLARNARRYVRKNTQDFFVHPQLGEFLRGELEVYLKHEFVQVWDAPDAELPRIRAKFALVRSIALDLITFLDQIEQFQATLFEKRKFVLQADYLVQCSWLQREGGEAGQALVAEAAAHPAQALEWAAWVGEKVGAKKKPKGAELLARYPHLPLHTRHFGPEFKARVLACFDDLEAALGGELVHADNYAALRTLEPAYRERVKCIYIDPPYNTDASPIDYKNGFRESSWLSLMHHRMHCAMSVLSDAGVMCIAIDDAENAALRLQLEHLYTDRVLGTVAVRANPSGRPTKAGFSVSHEYVHFVGKGASAVIGKMNPTDEQVARFSEQDDDGAFEWRNLRREGSDSERAARPAMFYPLFVTATSVRVPKMEWDDDEQVWQWVNDLGSDELIVWPIDDAGTERRWRWSHEKVLASMKDVAVRKDRSGKNYVYYKRRPNEEGVVTVTSWFDAKYSATEHGTALLKKLFGKRMFSYPKSVHAVQDSVYVAGLNQPNATALDFFAGSATTGHAVINLNREDGGERKFVLVEQGEYFDAVTLPRIAKVMTAPEWKDGQPKDTVQHADQGDPEHWSRRTLPLVRVLRLERYEDSLNALDFSASATEPGDSGDLLAASADEHLIRYWLQDDSQGQPVRLSTQRLADPFAYRLTLHEPTGPREVTVDLLETARLLLGLVPRRWREATDPQGRRHQWLEASRCADVARGLLNPPPVLLWLRPVDDERSEADARAEHDWLAAQIPQHFAGRQLADFATVLHNRAAFWPAGQRAESIDGLLAQRMLERAR